MNRIKEGIQKEPVLTIAAILAILSCFFVTPDLQYIGYIDMRVLALLYCLMVVVAGIEQAGVFNRMATTLLQKCKSGKTLCLTLVMLCFFSAMIVTNDVALITFVPFAILVMCASRQEQWLPWVISLQTVAANLGSMLTPIGNPQNLYLYNCYGFDAKSFFGITFPLTLVSFVVLCALCFVAPIRNVSMKTEQEKQPMTKEQKRQTLECSILFSLCLGTVFHLIEWPVLLVMVIIELLLFNRKLLKSADFNLLVTFVCFFVFAGNLARIPFLQEFLSQIMLQKEVLVSAIVSQVISNVPAAVLLSGFTGNGAGLLLGVNIGGLGTPIASLASLISLKAYAKTTNANMGKYLTIFSVLNVVILIVFLLLSYTFMK